MPTHRLEREVGLIEGSLQNKVREFSRENRIPVAKLIRMSLKYVLKDEKTAKQLLKFGDPLVETEE